MKTAVDCMCLPSKCYGDHCSWCVKATECGKGDVVVFGRFIAPAWFGLCAAAFSPFVIGAVVATVISLAIR